MSGQQTQYFHKGESVRQNVFVYLVCSLDLSEHEGTEEHASLASSTPSMHCISQKYAVYDLV